MNLTCLTGLTVFMHQTIRYRHIIPASIFLNGLLYHLMPSNKKLKKMDIMFNLLYGSIVTYKIKKSRPSSIIGICIYLINTKYNSVLLHVYGVQLPLSIALEMFLKKNKSL